MQSRTRDIFKSLFAATRTIGLGAACAFVLAAAALAGAPDPVWMEAYGGSGEDRAFAVLELKDGGYVLAGHTDSMGAGFRDMYLVRIDAQGALLWEKTYGGAAEDQCHDIAETQDGGFILVGATGISPAALDVLLVKTDGQGNEQWQETYGGQGEDLGRSVVATGDGGYLVAGDSSSFGSGGTGVYIFKTDAQGALQWESTFGGGDDHGFAAAATPDGGCVVGGYSGDGATFPEFDAYLVKIDAAGNLLWERSFDSGIDDRCHDLLVLPSGDIVMAGISRSDMSLWKTDDRGILQWQHTYGMGTSDVCSSLDAAADGGFVLGGLTYFYSGGAYEMYAVKTDAQGGLEWETTAGGPDWDWCDSIRQTGDGGYILAGTTRSFGAGGYDFFAVRLDGVQTPVTVELTPYNAPIVIPPQGGAFDYNFSITNNETQPLAFYLWTSVVTGDGYEYGPILGPIPLSLAGGASDNRDLRQRVPAQVPNGVYVFYAHAGKNGQDILDSDRFVFYK
jgi:hypothetical protein